MVFALELGARAHAELSQASGGSQGSLVVTIGLAKPVTVKPVARSEWAGEGRTVRLSDDAAGLEISCYGAQRVQFTRVSGPPPMQQLGLVTP